MSGIIPVGEGERGVRDERCRFARGARERLWSELEETPTLEAYEVADEL